MAADWEVRRGAHNPEDLKIKGAIFIGGYNTQTRLTLRGVGNGAIVYDTDLNALYAYQGNAWVAWESAREEHGFIDYNDTTGAVPLPSNVWTDVPNNGSGAFTNKDFAPEGVPEIMDTVTGYLDFQHLELGDAIFIRNDFTVTPSSNNAFVECRYVLGNGANEYQLPVFSKRLDNGAGVQYPSETASFYIYMGDENTLSSPAKLQVRVSSGGTLLNAGSAIDIRKKTLI